MDCQTQLSLAEQDKLLLASHTTNAATKQDILSNSEIQGKSESLTAESKGAKESSYHQNDKTSAEQTLLIGNSNRRHFTATKLAKMTWNPLKPMNHTSDARTTP